LLSDALNCVISMSSKFKDEIDSTTFDNFMKEHENVVYELSCLASNIKLIFVQTWTTFFYVGGQT
jgi:hypothetical protein